MSGIFQEARPLVGCGASVATHTSIPSLAFGFGRPPAARTRTTTTRRKSALRATLSSNMRLKNLVLALGAVVLPLGVLQNIGAVGSLSGSVHWLATSSSASQAWLESATTSAYAAYGAGDAPIPVDVSPPPSPSASVTTTSSLATTSAGLTAGTQANHAVVTDQAPKETPAWMRPDASALALNAPARTEFATISPRGVTLHFTFGTSSMMDFVKNVGAARRNRTTPSHARAQRF